MHLTKQQNKINLFLNKISSYLYKYNRLATENLLTIEDFINYKKPLTKLFGDECYTSYYQRLIKPPDAKKTLKELEVDLFHIPLTYGLDWVSMKFLTKLNQFRIDNDITSSNLFEIPSNLFLRFLLTLKHQWDHSYKTEICLYTASNIKKIVWDEEVLIALKENIPWKYLQERQSLKMTLQTIESCKNYICWSEIKSIDFFWDEPAISLFKEFLFYTYEKFNREVKAERLSVITSVAWNVKLIDKYYEYWDWTKLCSNPSIVWDDELIKYYFTAVDFKALSKNRAVKWDASLLQKYSKHVNWNEISARQDLPWSFEFLLENENYWEWAPDNPRYTDYTTISERRTSLSENPSIIWDVSMLRRWQDKVDFFLIARYSKITIEALIEFKQKFFQRELANVECHSWSDFRETADIYKTAWEVMGDNVNITLTSENVRIFNETLIDVRYPEGNLAHDGHWYEKNCTVLEVLREKDIDVSITFDFILEDSVNNNWVTKLLNAEFRNKQLWENVIKPKLDRDCIKAILENLTCV
jgi:hypothetical protein